eukprot:GHVR01117366.1.p1 GENE.GHVR01117366.1~~GHVR01117366.1.p1  ORF type:complete len:168 (-),score=49.53 GHVR01117366.1:153-656(-)
MVDVELTIRILLVLLIVDLGCNIDLKKVVLAFPYSEMDPCRQIHACVRNKSQKYSCNVYSSGTVIFYGSGTPDELIKSAEVFVGVMTRRVNPLARIFNIAIKGITCLTQLPFTVHLTALARRLGNHCTYDPESDPRENYCLVCVSESLGDTPKQKHTHAHTHTHTHE